jgi:serine/threonine protein kinase
MPDVLKTVGRYEILREVGRGGMAMVYLARQTDLDRFVALKELAAFHASDPAFAQRFLRESRVAGSLSHPNIVTVHDYFEHDGTPYIAMEYVDRGSLRSHVGRMTLAQVAGVLEGLLAGLAHAEQHGIVHRDLKPENLMVTADGRVKIADFGIAKATTKMQTGAFLTATGTTVGTPTYMAPEQAMAQEIGPWTDLYSVGCMAFELFTGKPPFHDSDAPMAILLRHVNEPIPSVKSIETSVDQGMSDWIDELLVKDPKQRTQSAGEAWDEFEEIVLAILGPRWRREARLSAGVAQVDTPKPLTPAPFEGTSADAAVSDDFDSVSWGTTPGPYTPPPHPGVPVPPEPEVGPPTPVPGGEDSGFVTFGAPAPAPPTDALLPGTEAPPETPAEAPAEPAADKPAGETGFETYIAPPPPQPPVDSPAAPPEPAAPEPEIVAEPEPEVVVEPEPEIVPPPETAPEILPPAETVGEVAPEPEVSPAGDGAGEVPATVMPSALREPEPEAPAEKRSVLPIAIGVGVLVAAVLGFVLGGSGGGSEPTSTAPAVPRANAAMKLKIPEGWADAKAPEVPGLTLADAKSAAGSGATVAFGTVREDADNSTLLPTGLLQAAGDVPEREAVKLGPDGTEAYRYANVELEGLNRPVTLYTVPTTQGVVTIACVPAAASCDGVANTLELNGDAFPVGPSADYAKSVNGALVALNRSVARGRAALGEAKRPAAQARAAADLRAAYQKAAASLRGQELSPADRGANARLVAALGGMAKAYGQGATAARNNSKAGFKRAGAAVDRAQRELNGALEGLRAAGYETQS